MDATNVRDRTEDELTQRIVSEPGVMAGKPVIRGTRLTVDYILNRLAHGDRAEDILAEYAYLKPKDIRACLLLAAAVDETRNTSHIYDPA